MTKHTKPLAPHEVVQLPDGEIDYSDIPELDEEFWQNAELVSHQGAHHAAAGPGSAGPFPPQRQRLSDQDQRRVAGIRADAAGKELTVDHF